MSYNSNNIPQFGVKKVTQQPRGFAVDPFALFTQLLGGTTVAHRPAPQFPPVIERKYAQPYCPPAVQFPPATPFKVPVNKAPVADNRYNLKVGTIVRGANVPSNDSSLIRKNFRGKILEFGLWGAKDVRIQDSKTGKKYKFQSKYLRPI